MKAPSLSSRVYPALVLGFVALWALAYPEVYLTSNHFLVRDNQSTNYPMFAYVTQSLRYLDAFPRWVFTNLGGIWIEPLTNNYMTLLPYRFVGYLLGWATDIPVALLYKLSFLWLGQGIYLAGLFWISKIVFESRAMAWLVVLVCLTTSVTLGMLHQEQVMGTVLYLPFLWVLLTKLKDSKKNLLWFGAVLGLTLDHQYPQLFILYLMAMISGLCMDPKESWILLKKTFGGLSWRRDWKEFGAAFLFFGLAASPVFYSYSQFKDSLLSFFRNQRSGIEVATYADYLNLHAIRATSLQISDIALFFQSYVPTGIRFLDDKMCFVTPALALTLGLLFIVKIPLKRFQVTVCALLLFFALGVHLEAARLLWYVLPGIKLFRQWYHLAPILSIHLIFLVVFALHAFWKKNVFTPFERAWLAGVAFVLLLLSMLEVLPWWNGVGGAAIIFLKLFPPAVLAQRWVMPTVICLWVFLGNLGWAIPTMNEFLHYKEDSEISKQVDGEFFDSGSFAKKLFKEGYPIRSLVNPKGIDLRQVATLFYRTGGVYWELKDKSVVPVPAEAFSVFPNPWGGFRFKFRERPTGGEKLVLLQFNDGRWNAFETGKPRSVVSVEKDEMGVMKVPVRPYADSVDIGRPLSLWHYLAVVSWIPMLGMLAWTLFQKRKRRRYILRTGSFLKPVPA